MRFHFLTFSATFAVGLSLLTAVAHAHSAPVVSSGKAASHLLAPLQLRCMGETEPLAVAELKPQFSWRLNAASANLHRVGQSAWRVEVASDQNHGKNQNQGKEDTLLWDSGKTPGRAAMGIEYAGGALDAGLGYKWRVRVWDEQDHATAWSAWAHWTEAPVWHAQWITAPDAGGEKTDTSMPLFRKSFSLDGSVKRARLYVTGLGQEEIHVNGEKAGKDELTPGWTDYRKTVDYESYDVTGMLHPGRNALGVLLGNGMYRVLKTPGRYTKFEGVMGPLQCIVQLKVDLANGKSIEIDSDGTWKTARGPITFSSTYGGEDFDARREPAGWDRAGFDDAAWASASVANGSGGTLTPEIAPPLRVIKTYAPVKITEPMPGVLVYDLGQNFAGWPEIEVAGKAGVTVKLTPGELLNPDGSVSQRSSGGPQWFAYTLRGDGRERWHPRFSYYGFRYVQVEGASRGAEAGKARILALDGQAVHSSSEPAGTFVSSDTMLNRIHTLILRAIENNAVSLFTDCPHREKLGWLEETHLMAPSMLYDFNFAGLYAATARNIADTQKTEGAKAGMVPEIAPQYVVFQPPDGGVFDDSPEWGSAAVIAPWLAYERSGDRAFLAAQLDVMRRYVAYLATRAKDGIIAYGLGDWYDIGPGSPGFSKLTTSGVTATAIYYQDLRVLEKATALLGYKDESQSYARQADAERDAFNARFFDTALHRYDRGSQTAQAMPLELGMVPEGESEAVLKVLVDDIRAHKNHVTAGDIGYHYVVDALLDSGRSDVLLDMLERTDTPSYGYQLAQGATALTEAWDANPNSSQDHFMLGHAEEWFYRGLGGITVDRSQPDARQIVIKPFVPESLSSARFSWARATYASSQGMIESSWKRDSGGVTHEIAIPAGAAATIQVVAPDADAVTVNGVRPEKAEGVDSARQSGTMMEIVVGSGRYRIRTREK